jgi:hypothetical protein
MAQPVTAKASAPAALAHAFRLRAQLAPKLRERSLRILISLTHYFGHSPYWQGRASSKQLAAVSLIEATPRSNRDKTTQPRRSGLSLRKAAAVRGLVAEKKIGCE